MELKTSNNSRPTLDRPNDPKGLQYTKIMKNRLKNLADTACQVFCGWRLTASKATLIELGSGSLEIQLLTGQCFFKGVPIEPLSISKELQIWFMNQLAAQKIPAEAIKRASIRAKVQRSLIPWEDRKNKKQVFYAGGQVVQTTEMHKCLIDCECEIVSDIASCTSRLDDVEEWPIGWPKLESSFSKPV